MTRLGLTPDQARCLGVIKDYAARGLAPTYDEIRSALGLASKSGINRLVVALEERGHIVRKERCSRSIALVEAPASPEPAAWLVVKDDPEWDRLFLKRKDADTHAGIFGGIVRPLCLGSPVTDAPVTRADSRVGATA